MKQLLNVGGSMGAPSGRDRAYVLDEWMDGASGYCVSGQALASSPGHSHVFKCYMHLKTWEWPGDEARSTPVTHACMPTCTLINTLSMYVYSHAPS